MAIVINGNGTVTGLTTGGISDTKSVADAAMAEGSIIQVVQTLKGDAASTNSTSFSDMGLSVTITPTSSSNKILVSFSIHLSRASHVAKINLLRGSTTIAQPDSATHTATLLQWHNTGSMQQNSYEFLDSPSTTSATTYKLQWCSEVAEVLKLNAYSNNTNYLTTSTMTAKEVSAWLLPCLI